MSFCTRYPTLVLSLRYSKTKIFCAFVCLFTYYIAQTIHLVKFHFIIQKAFREECTSWRSSFGSLPHSAEVNTWLASHVFTSALLTWTHSVLYFPQEPDTLVKSGLDILSWICRCKTLFWQSSMLLSHICVFCRTTWVELNAVQESTVLETSKWIRLYDYCRLYWTGID